MQLMFVFVVFCVQGIQGRDTQITIIKNHCGQGINCEPVIISDVSPDGKFVMLENDATVSNKKDVNLDGWQLQMIVDEKKYKPYKFRKFTLKVGEKVKIVSRHSASEAGPNDLVFTNGNWRVGKVQVTATLINDKGVEMSRYIEITM